ncbi:MAG: hypothetical protein AAF197_00345 [Pseudomonadota bacterium]
MLRAFLNWQNRNVLFDYNERQTFLMLLNTQLESGTPMSRILESMYDHPYTPVIRDVAGLALDAFREGKPISEYWDSQGYFSTMEAKLLSESESLNGREGLIQAVNYLRESTSQAVSFWQTVVFSNIVYIIASAYLFGFMIYLSAEHQDTYNNVLTQVGKSTADMMLFRLGNFFLDYGVFIAGFLILFSIGYVYIRQSMVGVVDRELANKLLFFNFYDRKFEYDVCGMVAAFMRQAIPIQKTVQIMADIYNGANFKNTRLLWVLAELTDGESTIPSFKGRVFSDQNYHLVELNATDDTPEELARSFEVTQQIAGVLLNRDFTRLGRLTLALTMLMSLFLVLGLFEFVQVMQSGTDTL